jgi:SAM-dependent methyltransferase
MAYMFRSFHRPDEHNLGQWADRSLQGELKCCAERTMASIFARYLPPPPARVLEAGCGLGAWVIHLAQRGYQAVGVDIEREVVIQGKRESPETPILVADVLALPHPDDCFDAYVSLGVVEHFEEGPQKALREAYRVLKPGGLAFVSVPYLSATRRLISHPLRSAFFFVWRRLLRRKDWFWEYRYSKQELARFLEDAGLKVLSAEIDDYDPADRRHHIGLYADFFFLRKKGGEIWELNGLGRFLLRLAKRFSPWGYCSGLLLIARKPDGAPLAH